VELGWLPPSMMPTTYPFVPTLDPHLNFPIGQSSVTGVSLITGAEGLLMRSLALIPSWRDLVRTVPSLMPGVNPRWG
jgi:hypothetical protein